MPNSEKSVVDNLRMTNVLWDGSSDSILHEVCIVQTNSSDSQRDGSLVDLTAVEYRTLQHGYDWFNQALFKGELPQVLITLQRHHRALGYFSAKRFQSRGRVLQHVHEVALNPDGFYGNSDKAILSILVHEMVHVWQEEYGRPGRGRYHNREWAGKMCSIGLMPSSTGRPGGAVTGESISHYILGGAEFDIACQRFVDGYRLAWESAPVRPDDNSGDGPREEDESDDNDSRIDGDLTDPRAGSRQTRTKFTCPNCGLNAWARPDAQMDCHRCSIEAREPVPMFPNCARPAGKAKPHIQSLNDGQLSAAIRH